jgi:hypothetical protein
MKPNDNAEHDDTEALRLPASLMLLPLNAALLLPLPKGKSSTASKRRQRTATPAQKQALRGAMARQGGWGR